MSPGRSSSITAELILRKFYIEDIIEQINDKCYLKHNQAFVMLQATSETISESELERKSYESYLQ